MNSRYSAKKPDPRNFGKKHILKAILTLSQKIITLNVLLENFNFKKHEVLHLS